MVGQHPTDPGRGCSQGNPVLAECGDGPDLAPRRSGLTRQVPKLEHLLPLTTFAEGIDAPDQLVDIGSVDQPFQFGAIHGVHHDSVAGTLSGIMQVDAVLFDHDDTLVDWWGSIRRAGQAVADDDVVDAVLDYLSTHAWDRRGSTVVDRNTWRILFWSERVFDAAMPHADPAERRLVERQFLEELWIGFFPETVPILDQLVDRYRLGLLSNNPMLRHEVQRLRLYDWFETAVDLPAELRKPHADAFARGVAAMGSAPGRTVYVGDSIENDAEGAHAAGLVSVWVDRFKDAWSPPAGVHRIESLAELPGLLSAL